MAGTEVYIISIIASSRRRKKLSKHKPIKTMAKMKGIINTNTLSMLLRRGMPKRGITIPKMMSRMSTEKPK